MNMHIFHVIFKTNRGEVIFDERSLQAYFLASLQAFADVGGAVLAYAIMPNHGHLMVRVPDPETLSRTMQRILSALAVRRNHLWQQPGVVFRQNFYRKPVLEHAHRIHLAFYIHSNVCPRSALLREFCAGDRTSHDAWFHNPPPWLDVETAVHPYGGLEGYLHYCREHLPRLASPPVRQLDIPLAEALLLQTARSLRVHPATLLDVARRGSPDRVILANTLAQGGVRRCDIERVMQVSQPTLRQWLKPGQADLVVAAS